MTQIAPLNSSESRQLEALKAKRDKATGFKRVKLTIEINKREP